MANKTAENPTGLLTGDVFKSFFSITGDYPDFTYTPGHERIPDNWYKRNPADAYNIPYFSIDIDTMAFQHPEFLSVGGNTGTTNSFVGVDPSNLTGGVYNAQNLAEGNNAVCFAMQASLQQAPDLLEGVFRDTAEALAKLSGAVADATEGLGCPQLESFDDSLFEGYPGYTEVRGDGTYP